MAKAAKTLNRNSKRSPPSSDHSSALDGRHKRVWKACERCRMKKTKCDGESPCKRCKDDGLVCTAGSRKKTEYKQIPRGYAEVLENTQFALNATVQKLYTMVRNNEPWTLGEPELNARGQPVIHDIATKLGCIRASPDLPYAIPEGEDGLAYLKAQLQSAELDIKVECDGDRKQSQDSSYSSDFQRNERASSSDSDGSYMSKNYSQRTWSQPQSAAKIVPPVPSFYAEVPTYEEARAYMTHHDLDTNSATSSPDFSNFPMNSFDNSSPFNDWAGHDELLGQEHALAITSQLLAQQAQVPQSSPLARPAGFNTYPLCETQMNDRTEFTGSTVSPGMLNLSQTSSFWQMN
ncbi:uncharacterized protein RAG0_13295 [Rhynchosporium agropyri]|uniref:Zn(2)-C6 fungal-type domain-containing protein n=1 Tax=Rhynchosporium agropyri TaxID=914238 RepID=A0A1E1LEC3_9HELO|nr:uncharacterized protein RAG0_13295 [Rhynchosporium agropyri]